MKNNKLIDNRGFVIVETIIVAVFVIGICTFLFANFIPLIGDYERINKYDDLDSKYKTHEIRKMILREISATEDKKSIFTGYISSNSGYHIYSVADLCSKLDNPNYCNKLLGEQFIDVKEIVVTPFKLYNVKTAIKNNNNASRALKEYINYLPKYDKYDGTYDSYYRIIVVFNNGHMANIEVNYDAL